MNIITPIHNSLFVIHIIHIIYIFNSQHTIQTTLMCPSCYLFVSLHFTLIVLCLKTLADLLAGNSFCVYYFSNGINLQSIKLNK